MDVVIAVYVPIPKNKSVDALMDGMTSKGGGVSAEPYVVAKLFRLFNVNMRVVPAIELHAATASAYVAYLGCIIIMCPSVVV